MMTDEQVQAIRARVEALPHGYLTRVKTLTGPWQLGVIVDHAARPLTDDEFDGAWKFVERAPKDIRALLDDRKALADENARLRDARAEIDKRISESDLRIETKRNLYNDGDDDIADELNYEIAYRRGLKVARKALGGE